MSNHRRGEEGGKKRRGVILFLHYNCGRKRKREAVGQLRGLRPMIEKRGKRGGRGFPKVACLHMEGRREKQTFLDSHPTQRGRGGRGREGEKKSLSSFALDREREKGRCHPNAETRQNQEEEKKGTVRLACLRRER